MKFAYPQGSDAGSITAWAKRLIDDLNRQGDGYADLPVFADDASASAGNVAVGDGYVTPGGQVRRRMA